MFVSFVLLFGLLLRRRMHLGSVERGIVMNIYYVKPIAFGNNDKYVKSDTLSSLEFQN